MEYDSSARLRREQDSHETESLVPGGPIGGSSVAPVTAQSARRLLGWTMTVLGAVLMIGGAAVVLIGF